MTDINKILPLLNSSKIIINDDGGFENIHFDSRKISKNDLFIAIKGSITDGHNYIDSVIEKGASAIVCEELPVKPSIKCTWIKVEDSSIALAKLANYKYNNPSQNLKLIGVTGTNGKTTIATSLFNIFTNLGYKCGLLSTIVNKIGDKDYHTTHTTSDAISINSLLQKMCEEGCEYCFMEVSSHAIHQNRIYGLNFYGGIFTNITHDHLDYHKTFKEYINTKKLFFDHLDKEAFALSNLDDKNGTIMLQNTKANKKFYSIRELSNFNAKILEHQFDGMLLNINQTEVWTKLIGEFNVSNLLAIYGTAIELGISNEEILLEISKLDPVNGRFDTIGLPNNKTAIVDYAHTPDALENVLKTIININRDKGRIITVIGTGGNRDKSKRPIMAHIAAKYSNKVILTSDNPRNEDPLIIIKEMQVGLDIYEKAKTISNSNREEAIKTAYFLAEPGDIILVAGKGHETYQEINGVKHHFDDKEIINQLKNNQ